MREINISLEIMGILVTLILLVCKAVDGRAVSGKPADKKSCLLTAMLVTNLCVLLADLGTWIFKARIEFGLLLYVLNFLVYSLGYVLTALFTYYLVFLLAERTLISELFAHVVGILCVIAVILVFVSLFNQMYFYFEQGIYIRGPMYWLSQAYPIVIVVGDMFLIFQRRKALELTELLILISYGVLPVIAMMLQILFYGITLLYLATTLSLLLIYLGIHLENSRVLLKKEAEMSKMQTAVLLSQIRPHFLFNVITSIRELCMIDSNRAGDALTDFAGYLRGNMYLLNCSQSIPFSVELEHVKYYLQLEKIRFGEKLQTVFQIGEDNFNLPSLTIQPLVENAVRHGVGGKEGGGTVGIVVEKTDGYIRIRIWDDGAGFNPAEVFERKRSDTMGNKHVGLENVRKRIEGIGGCLEICSHIEEGTVAEITIPNYNTNGDGKGK